MPTYRYTGDVSIAFPNVPALSGMWCPSRGDTVESDTPINHAWVELVTDESAVDTEESETNESAATPQSTESPVEVDETEESQ